MRTRRKKGVVLGSFLLSVSLLAGCSANTDKPVEKIEGLDKLGTITAVTREAGSGTRSVFAEKTNLESKDQNAVGDRIREDAVVSMNADAVMAQVANNKNAIGYVSPSAVEDDMENIKVIGVDGIKPDNHTIDKETYPLVRDISIAYSGKMTDTENDFLNYILSAGQEVVADKYIPVKRTSTFLSDQSKGNLTISGSSSATPLLEDLAKEYNKK